ncbi:hypothetical protein ACFWM7_00100 [Streptomyces sp. NPDC058375]|uniref:hypothetical protein n=1 Tax=Streptomyces sp. NPDC058375 TaxID=3346467 RepID=UPI003667D809
MSQPYDEQPPTPQGQPQPSQPAPPSGRQQPFGTPPPMPPGPPQPGHGPPEQGQQPVAGPGQQQPVAGNPYAQPVQGGQPQGYGYGGAQPSPYGNEQPSPYGNGGQAPPHGPHGPYGFPGAGAGAGGFPPQPGPPAPRKKTALIAVAAVLAVAVVGGGVWFAVSQGDDSGGDDAKSPTSVGTPSATGSGTDGSAGESPEATDPSTDPAGEPSVSPPARSDNPLVPQPTGTGLQAVWKMPDSTMLGLGEAYTDEPARINAILSIRDGLECKGRWQEDESGDFLEMALLCEEDGVRVASKDRVGNLRQNGDTLTVTWKKGATGTDTFERFSDMDAG